MVKPVLPALTPLLLLLSACDREVTPELAAAASSASTVCLQAGADPGWVHIPAGELILGAFARLPEEGPAQRFSIEPFWISTTEVTNSAFARFVNAAAYRSVAERPAPEDPTSGNQGSAIFTSPSVRTLGSWWQLDQDAAWDQPAGASSSIDGLEQLPAVHITRVDAEAYAQWLGCRLPTEAEWEYAARGGNSATTYSWGDKAADRVRHANTWQGNFPFTNRGTDGHTGLAPVGCFTANGYGLRDMIGNAWEWVSDPFPGNSALGMLKGGSFLCSDNYCARYRPDARHPQEPDFSASHIGFRVVCDDNPDDRPH